MSDTARAFVLDEDHPARKAARSGLVADPRDVTTSGVGEDSFLKPWLGPVDGAARDTVVPAEVAPPLELKTSLHRPKVPEVAELEDADLDPLDDVPAPQPWWRRLLS